MQGRILLALIIHGKHLPYKASFPNDGVWHHICVTWRGSSGHWAIYVDGDKKDTGSGTDTSRDIYANGILILGQDQDSFGGNFTEPFVGNITDLNVWNTSLETRHVRAFNTCSPVTKEVLFSWSLDRLISHPVIKKVQALLFCPVFQLTSSSDQSRYSAEVPLSFVCLSEQSGVETLLERHDSLNGGQSSRERYLKMKQMSDAQSSQPSAFMNHVMKLSNSSQVALGQQPSGLSSLAEASALLDVSVQALEDTQHEGLQPADMVSLIQLLSLAADVPTQPPPDGANRSQDSIRELSQHFISVADTIISQDNAFKWQAIKEIVVVVESLDDANMGCQEGNRSTVQVVNGPMDVVKSIDRMNPTGTVYDPVCAFWDFDLTPESGGWWNTKGCEVVSKQYGYTVCYCNHTTNFALLLQVYETQRSPENEKALQVLTFIGCGVSLCGLLFTFILFIAVGVPKSDRTTVHKNLIVALGIAELLLMCSNWASANVAACFVVTALLHLFFMASFSWMLVEGLLLWSKVVSVNISEDRRMKLYYIIGWGLPVLIVGVTLAVSVDEYKADDHCWLNVKTDTIWAFVGPVNAVVLCRVVMVTVSSARRRAKMLSPSSASKMQTFDLTWAVTRPVLILLPVLGLTWLCGVLVHLSVVVAYVFITLNAFQGLYIFLVYAVYNSESCVCAVPRVFGLALNKCVDRERRKATFKDNSCMFVSFREFQKGELCDFLSETNIRKPNCLHLPARCNSIRAYVKTAPVSFVDLNVQADTTDGPPYFQRVKSLSMALNCLAVTGRKFVIDSLNVLPSVRNA
ncbi:hypothetical protein PAMA_018776 [Pampus argenteus]